MVAQSTAWTPSASPSEAKGMTPAKPATATEAAVPARPIEKPSGVQWETSKDPPRKAKEPEPQPDAEDAPTAAERKIWKIKVHGKERDFDATDEAVVRRMIEKGLGADEAFEKAATTSKQAQQFFDMLKEAAQNPRKLEAFLKHPMVSGGSADFKKLAEQYLWEQIQEEKMTPEQKEERRIREELQRYKEQEEKAKAEAAAKERETLNAHYQESFSQSIQSAHKEVGLHTNPQSIYRMAEYARDAIDRGEEPNFKAIAARVKQDYLEEFAHYFENADAEQLKAVASESFLKKLRKMDVDRLKSTTPDQFKASTRRQAPSRSTTTEAKKLDGASWREKLIRERS